MGPDTVFFILILLGDCQTSHLTWVMYFINSKILGAILFSNIYSALFYLISLLKLQLYMCFTFDNFHQMSGALFCFFSNILFKSFVYQFGYFLIDLYQWLLFYSYIWGFVFFFFQFGYFSMDLCQGITHFFFCCSNLLLSESSEYIISHNAVFNFYYALVPF